MKRPAALILIALSLLLVALPCPAAESGGITVVVSSRLLPYITALQGFREGCGTMRSTQAFKTIQACPINDFFLSDHASLAPNALIQKIRADNPRMLIAIGTAALEAVKRIDDIPIVFLMVSNPEALLNGQRNITGINMVPPPEQEIDSLLNLLPTVKRIGLVHSRSFPRDVIRRLEAQARKKGVALLAREAGSPGQAPKLIAELAGSIDILWMPPDLDLLIPETVEHMLLFSTEQRVPIVSFSEKLLKRGASVVITFDAEATGRQASDLARQAFEQEGAGGGLPIQTPLQLRLLLNKTMARKLNLSLAPNARYFVE